jgi:hypothetical protein
MSCVAGCRVSQSSAPAFGGLVRIPLHNDYSIYGLIYDIRIDDDGLVRQLVTADGISDDVIQDNRVNRNVPVEVSVLHVGFRQSGRIFHLLPPRPPLSLDAIFICGPKEACAFTEVGRFGYFRHILRASDLAVGELLAAHMHLISGYHNNNGHCNWASEAIQELIVLLRDDYPTLMSVLGTMADTGEW